MCRRDDAPIGKVRLGRAAQAPSTQPLWASNYRGELEQQSPPTPVLVPPLALTDWSLNRTNFNHRLFGESEYFNKMPMERRPSASGDTNLPGLYCLKRGQRRCAQVS